MPEQPVATKTWVFRNTIILPGDPLPAAFIKEQKKRKKKAEGLEPKLQRLTAGTAGPPLAPAALPADYPLGDSLIGAGFTTIEKVKEADDATLLKISGLGNAMLAKIRAYTPPVE